MFKKSFLGGAALVLASSAFAQTVPSTSTTYSTAPTINVGSTGCVITGASVFNYNPSSNTLTLVNGVDSCNTSTGGGNLTASVTISISPSSYTLGSGSAAPVITWTNQTPAATVSCSLTPGNGFTVASSTANTFTLSTPTTAGTYSFTPTCTTSTSGYNAAVSVSGSATLTVVSSSPTTGCDASQLSTAIVANGRTLQRQCTGVVYMQPTTTSYSGALTDLGTVLGNKTFPNYSYVGSTPTFTIQSGYYVSLAFTPTTTGYIQFVANSSYGDGGTISLSTVPGGITKGASGVICALANNGLNSLYAGTATGTACKVTVGQTYYINFADVDISGNSLCNNSGSNTCTSAYVSYTLYAKAL